MWMYASEIYLQIKLISTESQFKKLWFNKKSQFNTDVPPIKILVHKLLDLRKKISQNFEL
jgi:hypothetical protein